MIPCTVPSPRPRSTTIPNEADPWRLALRGGLLAAALVLAVGCQAPGNKMTMRPSGHGGPVRVGDLSLNLRPLSPDLVSSEAAMPRRPSDLEGLVVGKPQPYRIGPEDVLLATVWDHPEITMPMGPNRTDASSGVLVDEGGYIFFPYVGKLKVEGMTPSEVREVLTARLAVVLRNPQVDLKVIAYRSQKVYISGEVRNPAVYTVTDVPFTLAEAINRAGGLLPTADDAHIVLNRGERSWVLNLPEILSSGSMMGQILLKDGDSLQVPNVADSPVYLMGEVVRPGNVNLTHGRLTLARAISEAGGIQQISSDATSIYVIRPTGSPKTADVFHLDARNPAAMVLADKFALFPHDIVYVDAGSLVRFNRVMSLLLPTITAATEAAVVPMEIRYFKKNS